MPLMDQCKLQKLDQRFFIQLLSYNAMISPTALKIYEHAVLRTQSVYFVLQICVVLSYRRMGREFDKNFTLGISPTTPVLIQIL
jgi:hypothetical protein